MYTYSTYPYTMPIIPLQIVSTYYLIVIYFSYSVWVSKANSFWESQIY